jgi:hypothetical protein
MKRSTASHSKWDLESLAYIGALLGLLPAGMHQLYSISIRDYHGGDPFLHMMVELIGGALGGAVLLCAMGWLRNKQLVEKTGGEQKATSKPDL